MPNNKEFDALSYWERQRDSAETALIIAQQNLHRLIGAEALENVIVVDFGKPEEDDIVA